MGASWREGEGRAGKKGGKEGKGKGREGKGRNGEGLSNGERIGDGREDRDSETFPRKILDPSLHTSATWLPEIQISDLETMTSLGWGGADRPG